MVIKFKKSGLTERVFKDLTVGKWQKQDSSSDLQTPNPGILSLNQEDRYR